MKASKRKFKLKIEEVNAFPEDQEKVIRNFKHIKELHSLSKKVKDKVLHDIFQREIQDVRQNLLDKYARKFFKVIVSLGPHKMEEFFPQYPVIEDIVDLKNQMLANLSKNREQRKEMKHCKREFNGMRYEMVGEEENTGLLSWSERQKPKQEITIMPNLKGNGRVFKKPGTVLKLVDSPEYASRITRAKKPYDKSNYVGVELELICKANREVLNELFIRNKLAGLVYVKGDSSIARENSDEQTHEVTIIGKQQNINDVINRVCKVLNSKEVGAYVNNSCGLHVHLDMRNRDPKMCYMNLYKALPVLAGMVPANRTKDNKYCRLNTHGNFDDKSMGNYDRRYQAINPVAYESHKTLEIRLHSGSLNATKINNWINILLAVISKEGVTEYPAALTAHDMINTFGISDELVNYINKRTDKFKKDVSTKQDHYDDAV